MEKIKNFFRPSLIIFVGEVGNAVYQHLCHRPNPVIPALIEYIQKSHLRWIEFMRPGENNAVYLHQLAGSNTAMMSGNLDNAFLHMYDTFKHNASSISTSDELFKQDDDISDSKPLVYIVSHVCDQEMREAVDMVRARQASWNISCLCCCYPVEQAPSNCRSIIPDDLVEWGRKLQLDFCYLFGDNTSGTPDAIADRATIDYAVAQALFTLLTVGITTQNAYKDAPQFKLGTLSTCLINVPREAILRACQSYIAALMIADWLAKSEEVRKNNDMHKEICKIVADDVNAIKQWIIERQEQYLATNVQEEHSSWLWNFPRKSTSTPPTEQYTGSGLSILKGIASALHKDLVQSTKDLFQHTIPDNWPPSQMWLDRAEQSYKTIQEATWSKWKQLVGKAWDEVRQNTNTTLEKLTSDKQKEAPWIIAYVDSLDEELEKLQKQVNAQQKDENPSGRGLASDKYLQLRSTLIKAVEQQPSKPALLVLAGLAWISMLVLLLLLINICFPLLGGPGWTQWLIVVLLPLIGILADNWLFVKGFYLPGIQTKHALLHYYHHAHALYHSSEEQEQHASTIQTLRLNIKDMKSDNLNSFKERFEKDAEQLLATLFKTVVASRCIFVGDNRYFKQNDEFVTYTFLKQMSVGPTSPKPTAERMFNELVNNPLFSSLSARCLSTDMVHKEITIAQELADSVSDYVGDFCEQIDTLMKSMVSPAMIEKGLIEEVFDINVRKRVDDMWDDIFTRLNRKLWRKQEEIKQGEYIFLCGSDKMLTAARQRVKTRYQGQVIELSTSSDMRPEQENATLAEQVTSDWFLIAAPYHDNTTNIPRPTE